MTKEIESENLSKLENAARANGIPIIRTESGEFLAELVKKNNPTKILEFGTAVGFSGIKMLNASHNSTLVTIEIDSSRAQEALINFENANLSKRVNVINDDALVYSNKLVEAGEKFDFVFLDSAKGQYINLLPSITKLLTSGGTLVADNVLFRGFVYGECPRRFKTISKRLREFIGAMEKSTAFKNVNVYEIEDGILVATKI